MDVDNERLSELIFLLAHGSKPEQNAALQEIYDTLNKIFYRVGNTYYKKKEDIDDSIQNLLFTLFLKAKKYKSAKNACGWIMQIYRNTFVNFYRRSKCEKEYFERQVHILRANSSDFENYFDKYCLYNYILSKLNKYETNLFYYHYLYGYSIGEIAKALNKPKSTIQYQLEKLEIKIRNL